MSRFISKIALAGFVTILAASLTATALHARPFHHKFGELREYHKHWLAVCPHNYLPNSKATYRNSCWASTFSGINGRVDGDFPGDRLSISRHRGTGKMEITFVADVVDNWDRTKPVKVVFSNGATKALQFWRDVTTNGNTINEFRIADALVPDMIDRMKNSSHVRLVVPLKTGGRPLFFSTMGLTSAIKFTQNYAE